MTSLHIPEEIIGVPLFVPTEYETAFEIDEGGMPNGDDCLIIRGDLDPAAKAVQIAPTLSPDIFHVGENPAAMNDWSMACWLKLSALGASGSGRVMFGASNHNASGGFTSATNRNIAMLFGPNGTVGGQFDRQTITNAASPSSSLNILAALSTLFTNHQDYWVLMNINVGPSLQGEIYLDGAASASVTDTFSGTTTNGVLNSGMYLHIGPLSSSHLGRTDLWRMGKWVFFDHALSWLERRSLYNAMWEGQLVFVDDFNRASLGSNWIQASGSSGWNLVSNQIAANLTTERNMYWVRDLGTPDMYGEITCVNNTGVVGGYCGLIARGGPTNNWYTGFYEPSTGTWRIQRRSAGVYGSVLASAVSSMTLPGTIRMEIETVGSDVDIRLYEVAAGVPILRCSYTDLAAATPLLAPSHMGVRLVGTGAGNQIGDNFECGPLAA